MSFWSAKFWVSPMRVSFLRKQTLYFSQTPIGEPCYLY